MFLKRSKLFVCINLIVEGVGNIVYIFNRRPIVFKKLFMFLRAILLKTYDQIILKAAQLNCDDIDKCFDD